MDGMEWHLIPQYLSVLIIVCPSTIPKLHLLSGRLFSSRFDPSIQSELISSPACDEIPDV